MQEHLKQKIKKDDFIICADGGYDIARLNEITPNLAIGDFDSIDGKIDKNIPVVKLPVEKDDTDMMYCARKAIGLGYKEILILAATGKRLDHSIANISVLLFLTQNGIDAYMADDMTESRILLDGKYKIKNKKNKTISIFPYGTAQCTVSYNGMKYPLSNQNIDANFPVGISNIVLNDEAEVMVHSGPVLMITCNVT